MGEEGEGYVPVPAMPAPYLIVGEAHFAFRFLKADLGCETHTPETGNGTLTSPLLKANKAYEPLTKPG